MNRVVAPGSLSGSFRAPASKSHAHRLLICAALGTAPVTVLCDTFSDDILATIDCLTAMGAQITHEESRISVTPVFASRKPDGLCKLPCRESGSVVTETNHCGGILGGISNGMPIVFRAAVKPTPSIGKPQNSVRLSEKQNEVLHIHGRHDPCIVPRAVPCMEAAAAIAIFDALAASGTYRR